MIEALGLLVSLLSPLPMAQFNNLKRSWKSIEPLHSYWKVVQLQEIHLNLQTPSTGHTQGRGFGKERRRQAIKELQTTCQSRGTGKFRWASLHSSGSKVQNKAVGAWNNHKTELGKHCIPVFDGVERDTAQVIP